MEMLQLNTSESSAPPLTLTEGEPIHALIVDDSAFDRRHLIRACEDSGLAIECGEVATLAELRHTLEEGASDLVFIDYLLNDGDGLMALEMVRSHPLHVSCPAIMIAGSANIAVAVSAVKAGCNDYIEKADIGPASIYRAVTNALQKAELTRDVASARGLNEALARVLNQFARDCVVEMKPLLSRILRQVRAPNGINGVGAMYGDAGLEASCTRLWAFLEEIENYSQKLKR